ncbi:hypothetical protein PC116_g5125 [Phytophthora cactorum]|nr:hypothetical protein PC114_g8653 [Phytophthora cactorum]KAG2922889.1 hypothetical protein PC117_g15883 [Phytophthora cactorum]KAG3024083.1 hypothetical protein PC120_g7215 [Phytophthora cactorum]KAG3025180.1 hypothetical protein PC119_g8247 [Phytophthora cactorum]KAG3173235.1 hypothetical protein C6341_g10060 [Phytophthora cactorum]
MRRTDSSDRSAVRPEEMDAGPRIELATHRPLDRMKLPSGRRNKGDNSMQWLKTFVYEMKGLALRRTSGALLLNRVSGWRYLLVPTTAEEDPSQVKAAVQGIPGRLLLAVQGTAGTSLLLGDQGSQRAYLRVPKPYGRNARLPVEKGLRDARDHVKPFLLTCGDVRHMRYQPSPATKRPSWAKLQPQVTRRGARGPRESSPKLSP